MPTVISGPRRARSFVTPTGAAVVSRVIDFNFATNQGIEITAVLGTGLSGDSSPATSDTVPVFMRAQQSLHLEEGQLEDVPIAGGDDADEVDTEVFFQQEFGGMFQVPATAGGGGGSSTPGNLYVAYKDPILVARNITHRGETVTTGQDAFLGVLIFYHYVVFTIAELGLILARRQ